MQLGNPVTAVAEAYYHSINLGFSDIHYMTKDWSQGYETGKALPEIPATRRPSDRDVAVVAMFAQTWGSTALGFGGMGGAAMTPAYTVILYCRGEHAVYFDGRFAYLVKNGNDHFREDIGTRSMRSVAEAKKWYEL